jgi:hypothetical protein
MSRLSPTPLYLTCLDPAAPVIHPPYVSDIAYICQPQRGQFVWLYMNLRIAVPVAGSCRLLALHPSLPVVALPQPPQTVLPLNPMVLTTLSLFAYYARVL